MRVFLRSSKTGRYYGESGKLDAEPGNAHEFPSVQAAARRALSAKLVGVKIALRCDYLSEEVFVPVVPEWCDFDENHRRQASTSQAPLPAPA
jgi:hypothetical protein